MLKKSGLSRIFKAAAAASAAAMLAASLTMGAPGGALAQTAPNAQQQDAQIYRHDTLASTSTEPVGVQLVLAMDTSGSMSNEEFAIELQATAHALNSEIVRSVIKYKAGENSISVAVVDFDDFARVRIAWVDIRAKDINDKPYQPGERNSSAAPDKLDALAQEIINLPRLSSGGTSINTAMNLARKLYLGSPWGVTERRVLDVFGDGTSTTWSMQEQRDRLAAMGVTINGFAIVNDVPTLESFFRDFLVTQKFQAGPDGIYSEPGRVWAVARNLQASGNSAPGLKAFFGEVSRGMRQKISVEIAGTDDYYRTLDRLGLADSPALPAQAHLQGQYGPH